MVVLGISLHFFICIVAASLLYFIASRVKWLPRNWFVLGILYGVAFLAVFGFEAVFTPSVKGQQHGLGYMITATRASIDMKSAYAGIVIAALLGVIVSGVISWVGRLATPWADEERDGGRG